VDSDKYLVLDLRSGSERAFEVLYNKYSKKVYYFAFGYLKNKDDAEGIVQEVFVKIWNKRLDLNEEKSFSSFLLTIAKNRILDIFKKRTHEINYKRHLSNCYELVEERTKNDIIFSDLEERLSDVVNSLPKKRRIIYKLSRYKGLSNKDIAKRLELSEKTIENQMTLALSHIKQKFQFVLT